MFTMTHKALAAALLGASLSLSSPAVADFNTVSAFRPLQACVSANQALVHADIHSDYPTQAINAFMERRCPALFQEWLAECKADSAHYYDELKALVSVSEWTENYCTGLSVSVFYSTATMSTQH